MSIRPVNCQCSRQQEFASGSDARRVPWNGGPKCLSTGLFALPSSPLDQRPDRLDGEENAGRRHRCENEQRLEKEIDKEIHKLKFFLDKTDELIKLRDYTEMDIANRRAGKIVGSLSDIILQAKELKIDHGVSP